MLILGKVINCSNDAVLIPTLIVSRAVAGGTVTPVTSGGREVDGMTFVADTNVMDAIDDITDADATELVGDTVGVTFDDDVKCDDVDVLTTSTAGAGVTTAYTDATLIDDDELDDDTVNGDA